MNPLIQSIAESFGHLKYPAVTHQMNYIAHSVEYCCAMSTDLEMCLHPFS